jgi:hypothetical protein
MTSDVSRWWGIVISRIKTADGTSENLIARSESNGPQIHCDLKNVRWSNVIDKFRKLPPVPDIIGEGEHSPLDPSDNLDSIEAQLAVGTRCQINVECKKSDLEEMGFK